MKKKVIRISGLVLTLGLLSSFLLACEQRSGFRFLNQGGEGYWGEDYYYDDYDDYYEEYSKNNKKSSSNNNSKKSSSNGDDVQYTSWEHFYHTFSYVGAGQVAIKAKESCRELLNIYVPKTYKDDKGNEYQVVADYDEGFEVLSSTSITLPDGFETIRAGFDNSFYLKKIYLPSSIKKIEGEIIVSCFALEKIYYEGTKAQWNAIDKDERWNFQAPAFVISCSDGMIEMQSWAESHPS